MKKIFIITSCILVAILVSKYILVPQKGSLSSDEDFINFAIAADKRLMTILFEGNPELLIKNGLNPVKIETRDDVYNIMSPYWDDEFIEKIWQEGSKFKVNNDTFGFYTEGNMGLLEAEDIKVKDRSSDKVIISGKSEWTDATTTPPEVIQYDRELVIHRTAKGWKAKMQ